MHTHSMGVVSGLTAQGLDTLLRVLADSGAFHDAWGGRVGSRPICLGHDQPSLAVTLSLPVRSCPSKSDSLVVDPAVPCTAGASSSTYKIKMKGPFSCGAIVWGLVRWCMLVALGIIMCFGVGATSPPCWRECVKTPHHHIWPLLYPVLAAG